MEKSRVEHLISQLLSGRVTAEERDEIRAMVAGENEEAATKELFLEIWKQFAPSAVQDHRKSDAAWNRVRERIFAMPRYRRMIFRPRIIATAASILIFLTVGVYIVYQKPEKPLTAFNKHRDIAPGKHQATLTLANGQKIMLTKFVKGQLARQGNSTQIIADSAKGIIYSSAGAETRIVYNTISTGRGEQSPIPFVLSDGTRIWLNAASSLTFPTAFTGKSRMVTMTGEAYFEVNRKPNHFKVSVNGHVIEDLGTHFNINAYPDEPYMKTTLLEGSLSDATDQQRVVLYPGQQAVSRAGHSAIKVKGADVEATMAWRNGLFHFSNADLYTVMRQFSRWYDVDVEYRVSRVDDEFTGDIPKDATSLENALKIIQRSGIQFKVEGRKIIITK